jgi:hypothetical protein
LEELVAYYQPIVSLERGRIVGFEALNRWLRPEGAYWQALLTALEGNATDCAPRCCSGKPSRSCNAPPTAKISPPSIAMERIVGPDSRGQLMWDEDALTKVISYAARHGLRVGVHAWGDRAVRTVLDVYERGKWDRKALAR